MIRRAFTMLEVLLVIALMAVLLAFAFPNIGGEIQRRALVDSADRLRSVIMMARAKAMQDGVGYRIEFPNTPDPLDPNARKEIEVPVQTEQPNLFRQVDPLNFPDAYGEFEAGWKPEQVLSDGVRCVAVMGGRPSFDIGDGPIAGPSVVRGEEAPFVPLTLYPDGTCDWVTFVLTDLPPEVDEIEEHHVGRILNVIVDGRTGQAWVQRALRKEEVELMNERGASPILHMDFTRPELITEENILEIHVDRTGGFDLGSR